jgi:hypothetical protein
MPAAMSKSDDAASGGGRLGLVCCGLYAANVLLHAVVFAKRNPTTQPRRQSVLLMLARLLFGLPVNVMLGAWLALWVLFWEVVRRPLWKPSALPLPRETHASVAMCGGGFRTWYHLGIYWGLYDRLGVEVGLPLTRACVRLVMDRAILAVINRVCFDVRVATLGRQRMDGSYTIWSICWLSSLIGAFDHALSRAVTARRVSDWSHGPYRPSSIGVSTATRDVVRSANPARRASRR